MMLYANGYHPTSECMARSKDQGTQYLTEWCTEKGDEIIVKIDTKQMRALVWNERKLKLGDISFEDAKNALHVILLELPLDKKLALALDVGAHAQTMAVLDQTFISTKAMS